MKTGMIATLAGLALAGSASASFVEFYTVKTQVTHVPTNTLLDIYKIYARFNGPTDTILNAFNLNGLAGATMNGFYHKDNTSMPGFMGYGFNQNFGTWAPSLTGSATLNRPYDSNLTIGGIASATNGTNADPSWGNPLSWNRADIPNGLNVGWFAPGGSIAGRVGQAGNTANSVILGQFVIGRDVTAGVFSISISYNSGVPGTPVQFANGTFDLGCFMLYRDIDGDGLGASSDGSIFSCTPIAGYVPNNSDNCPSIANPGQEDCNANSMGDVCEIAAGISPDCDSDGRPDNCEGAVFVAAQSNLLALTGAVFAEQTFTGLVSAYGAQPKITIEATADLGAANDGVIVSVDGGTGSVYFLTDGIDCPTTPNTAVLSYGLPAFNAMVADGALTVRVSAFGAVNSATCANGGVRIKLNYTGLPPSADCNNNGVLDSCEIATGAQPDCNGNGVPDSCDIASGYSADCNSNGKPDTCDIASGASSDINANGRPDDCSGELVVGGSGFATVQAAIFAAPIGATIVVGPGVRHEYIGIDRRITLRSAAGAATTILDGAGLSQSIVSFLGTDSNGAVLDGFTIRNGPNGSDFGVLGGGGVTLVQSNGTVRNCVFLNNHSDVGGAVYGILSAATIEGCTFTGNSAAVSGGAIQFELGSGWTVRDCDFTNNISAGVGGVAHAISTMGVIADCAMTGNHATGAGGAISWDSTDGGAIRVAGCSIEANFAASGGGIAVVAGIGAVDLFQSRLCRNMPDNLQGAINDLGGNIIGTDCNGNGVCDADEIAAGTAFDCNANGVLDSCDLASTTSLDCNENDIPDSCDIASGLSHDIDSNGIPDECKPDCDHDGVPDSWELSQGIEVDCNLNGRPDSCDIAASSGLDKNGNGHLDSCELARGDLNLDSVVNAADLSIMLNFWGWLNPPVGDLDGDNTVSGADLATLLNNWGTAP